MKPKISLLFLFALVFFISGPAFSSGRISRPETARIAITGQTPGREVKLDMEIASTPLELERGLMDRTSLGQGAGMLFLFQYPAIQQFWMKDTLIPLDMLFIDEHGKIINIHRNAKPNDLTPIPSASPALAVIEINGGGAKLHDIRAGDIVHYKAFKQP